MKSGHALRSRPAILGLLLVFVAPVTVHADAGGPARSSPGAHSPPRAKPLSIAEGDAVRAQVGKRCILTLINGTTREGRVTQVQPGAWLKLATPSGVDEQLSWQYIAAVSPASQDAGSEQPKALPADRELVMRHQGQRRTVHLTDGTTRQGMVSSLMPGAWLKLATDAGSVATLAWGDIESLEVPPSASGAATQATAGGVTAAAAPAASQSAPDPRAATTPAVATSGCSVLTPRCRIVLRDGSILIGRFIEIRPGTSRTLQLPIGTTRELAWDEVQTAQPVDATTPLPTAAAYVYRPPSSPAGSANSSAEGGGVALITFGAVGVAIGLGSAIYAGIGSLFIAANPRCFGPDDRSCDPNYRHVPDYGPVATPAILAAATLVPGAALIAVGAVSLAQTNQSARSRR